jgi:fructokinase
MPLDVITTHDTVVHQAGGTAANVAAILAYLGWNAILAGQTGDDPAGDILVDDLKHAGVDTVHLHRPVGMPTPRLIHSVRPDGHSFSYRCPACQLRLPRSRPLTVAQARACITSHPTAAVYFFDRVNAGTLTLAEHYAGTGTVIVFEPSVPVSAELLGRAVAVAHIVKHSDHRSVGGLDDVGVRSRRGQLRIVTHGAEGLELRIGEGRNRRFAALATLAVDTGGAGDWTTAGLIAVAVRHGGLRNAAIDDGLRFGQALSALSCTAVGARGLMRLRRSTVLRHARAVLAHGGVTTEPRYGEPPRRVITDACATCLLPASTAALRAVTA